MIPLETQGGQGRLYWFLNRRPLEGNDKKNPKKNRTNGKFMSMPGPGTYQLAVMDEAGNSDMVTFKVIASNPP